MDEDRWRHDLVTVARLSYDRRLTFGSGGNLSLRMDRGSILITPSGTIKGLLSPEQMIRVDLETGRRKGEGPRWRRRSTLASTGPGGGGCGGPPTPSSCTVLAILGRPLRTAITPEGVLVLGRTVPMIDYATPGTQELADKVVAGLAQGTAGLLRSHGALTVGGDIMEAFGRMETMEYIATLQLRCEQLGGMMDLPPEEVSRILSKH
jgi:L-fuculose-phosphate aldolase